MMRDCLQYKLAELSWLGGCRKLSGGSATPVAALSMNYFISWVKRKLRMK